MEQVEVFTREELLLETLAELIREVVVERSGKYNILIAEIYAELLREVLIQKAEAGMGLAKPESLLLLATSAIERRLQERLGEIQFNLFSYKENIYETLKAPAKELLVLQECLKIARSREELPIDEPTESGGEVPFRISEVGLKNSEIQSLIAIPDGYKCYLDFNQVAEICTVKGNWFPFELLVKDENIGDLVFVVDQDGSINTHTENFPAETLNRTRNILKDIARKLYAEHDDYESELIEV